MCIYVCIYIFLLYYGIIITISSCRFPLYILIVVLLSRIFTTHSELCIEYLVVYVYVYVYSILDRFISQSFYTEIEG